MFRLPKRGTTRLSAAVLATGLAAAGMLVTAGPAAADTQNQSGATAVLEGLNGPHDTAVNKDNNQKFGAGLFTMAVDGGGELQTYCIDLGHSTINKARYNEADWSATSLQSNPDAGKILWILENSYPKVNDLALLAKEAGVNSLTEDLAAAGTQVAIWRYSDHKNVEATNESAEKLADYLFGAAKNVAEPKASLTLEPSAVSGNSGDKIGPVKVSTNASSVTVELDAAAKAKNVSIVNASGEAVTTAANGDALYFNVPKGVEDGFASLTAKATTSIPAGRAFTAEVKGQQSQTQILAGSSAADVSATATGNWAAPDTKGPIPAVSAAKSCAKGGVEVTASNAGDEDFTFQLSGEEQVVKPGESKTILVKVDEDQPYEITVTGPNGYKQVFKGVLDCQTASDNGGTSPSASASPVGNTNTGTNGDLAETGSSSATPVIAGVAIVLVIIGGGAVFFVRKRKSAPSGE